MKTIKIIQLLMFLLVSITSYGQNKFSANSKALAMQLHGITAAKSISEELINSLNQLYPIRLIQGQYHIGALIKVNPDFDQSKLNDLGARVNTRINNIWSVTIPLTSVQKLNDIEGIQYVEVDTKIRQKLDAATAECNVNLVHSGTGLKMKCYGDSVVIGIVDGGFDFTHPTFYDTSGTNLRILRAWDQEDTQGPPPPGFTYGTEIVGSQALLDKKSAGSGDHGTHVAGIASGSAYLVPDFQYMGVAPAADLIFINCGDASSSVTDGINYIFQYAGSIGRPAVVNLSLGSHIGPHDGTSLMDQAIDGLAGQGRIVAGAAGNEGDTPLHLYHAFSNDTVKTFMDFASDDPDYNSGRIDQWGSAGSDFSMSLSVMDENGEILASTPFYAASENPSVEQVVMIGSDSLHYRITGVASNPQNQKPNLLAEIDRLSNAYWLTLIITSATSQVHVWNDGTGDGASLYDTLNGEQVPGYTAGDNSYTVGEIGGTSNKIISVGAYTTKNQFVNIKGETITGGDPLGQIAYFSSLGPTADGRTKPEITAPGEKLVSSVNSFSPEYDENNSHTVLMIEKESSKWYFAAMQGTSMATPMTTGIIALMLQANHMLEPQMVKQLLKDNARTDSFTGEIPPEGSNLWGWGKIDAQKAVLAAFNIEGIENYSNSYISLYPNPTTGVVYLKNDRSGEINSEIRVFNSLGINVLSQPMTQKTNEACRLDLSGYSAGLYLITFTTDSGENIHLKVVINK